VFFSSGISEEEEEEEEEEEGRKRRKRKRRKRRKRRSCAWLAEVGLTRFVDTGITLHSLVA